MRATRRKAAEVSAPVEPVVVSSTIDESERVAEKPKKAGWWQRKSFF